MADTPRPIQDFRRNYPSTLDELREWESRSAVPVMHQGRRPMTLRETLSEMGLTAKRHDCADVHDSGEVASVMIGLVEPANEKDDEIANADNLPRRIFS